MDIYKFAQTWMQAYIRTGPGISYPSVGLARGSENKEYTGYEIKNGWLRVGTNQWIVLKDSGLTILVKIRTENVKPVAAPTPVQSTPAPAAQNNPLDYSTLLVSEDYNVEINNTYNISDIEGIFGLPYQFMPEADTRIDIKNPKSFLSLGRKYAKEIVANMPLLLITPGVPKFMGDYSSAAKESALSSIIDVFKTDSTIDSIIGDGSKAGKYYSFEYAYPQYYQYVTTMCNVAARLLDLQDVSLFGNTKLGSYNWANLENDYNKRKFGNIFRGSTGWYCESETSITDSFSNNTDQSIIASKINDMSSYGRELQFLLGSTSNLAGWDYDKIANTLDNMTNVNNFINKTLGNSAAGNILKSLTNGAKTVIQGGKMVFPELWSDSSFGREYSIKLKLVSPDYDNLSVYLNIIVPMLHLLGLVLPRETVGGHGYISPFLVRAYYKGLFNVNMGIITSMSFAKGKECAWTASGLPTIVEVDFTIKDLYSDMYLSRSNDLFGNIILMDYISNLCGINIHDVEKFGDLERLLDLYALTKIGNPLKDRWRYKIWGELEKNFTQAYSNIFGNF